MSTKWIKKIDEKRLIDCELFPNSLIYKARKNVINGKVSLEILTYEKINDDLVEDFDVNQLVKENNLKIGHYEFFDDFANKFKVYNKGTGCNNLSGEFVKLLTSFFYQPYYCEYQIVKNEKERDRLAELYTNMSIDAILKKKIKQKISNCERNINNYYNELNEIRALQSKRQAQRKSQSLNDFQL